MQGKMILYLYKTIWLSLSMMCINDGLIKLIRHVIWHKVGPISAFDLTSLEHHPENFQLQCPIQLNHNYITLINLIVFAEIRFFVAAKYGGQRILLSELSC